MPTARRKHSYYAFVLLGTVAAATMSAAAQEANVLWQQVAQPVFDPAKTATVENITL